MAQMIRSLIERGLRIAQMQPQDVSRTADSIFSYFPPTGHIPTSRDTGVHQLGAAINMLSLFPSANKLASQAAYKLCIFIQNSTHLIPGPGLKDFLRQSYKRRQPYIDKTSGSGNFLESWDWIRSGMKERSKDWGEVGVSVDHVMDLVRKARAGGNVLNRHQYSAILKLCLCLQGGLEDSRSLSNTFQLLCGMMIADCGKEEVKEILLSSLQLATSKNQIHIISLLLVDVASDRPWLLQEEQLSASLTVDKRATRAMDLFTWHLHITNTPPSIQTYEFLINTFTRTYQLHWAMNVFNSITVRYRVAPSWKVYENLTLVMMRRAFLKDERVTVQLCARVLSATIEAYNGKPPPWVYAEMSKVLICLSGLEGYQAMFRKAEERLDQMKIVDKRKRRDCTWRPLLYDYLIRSAVVIGDQDLALHMLSEKTGWGFSTHAGCYKLLLQLVSHSDDLQSYFSALMEHLCMNLTWDEAKYLRETLIKSLYLVYQSSSKLGSHQAMTRLEGKTKRGFDDYFDPVKPIEVPGFILAMVRGLLDETVLTKSHRHCIEKLETLANSYSDNSDFNTTCPESQSTYNHARVAQCHA